MSTVKARDALQQYGSVGTQSDLAYASPHRLIQMLLDGALDKLAVAKGHMERGEIESKGNYISWAISIIEGLRVSLDAKAGGELAANLEALYDYMERRLVEANARNDGSIIDEVAGLLKSVKEAWDAIPQEVQDEHAKQSGGDNATPNLSGKA